MTCSVTSPARSRSLSLPRLRQAVLAAYELELVAAELRHTLGLGEPYADPAVAMFGLENAVFALGDTFLEVVSPTEAGTAVGRWLERQGGDCGYMVMFEVGDLEAALRRAAERGVREVFAVEVDDIAEVHLHPADVGGAIVAVSAPQPPGSWRWGGPGWEQRSRPLRLAAARLAVDNPIAVADRWSYVLGAAPEDLGIRFSADATGPGLVEVIVGADDEARRDPVEIAGVRFTWRT